MTYPNHIVSDARRAALAPRSQSQVMRHWLANCAGHPNRWADAWEQRVYRAALTKGFKRGVQYGRTGR